MAEDVIVYYITGRQLGPLSVPASWCEECDLTVRAVKNALTVACAKGLHLLAELAPGAGEPDQGELAVGRGSLRSGSGFVKSVSR